MEKEAFVLFSYDGPVVAVTRYFITTWDVIKDNVNYYIRNLINLLDGWKTILSRSNKYHFHHRSETIMFIDTRISCWKGILIGFAYYYFSFLKLFNLEHQQKIVWAPIGRSKIGPYGRPLKLAVELLQVVEFNYYQ